MTKPSSTEQDIFHVIGTVIALAIGLVVGGIVLVGLFKVLLALIHWAV